MAGAEVAGAVESWLELVHWRPWLMNPLGFVGPCTGPEQPVDKNVAVAAAVTKKIRKQTDVR